MQPFYYLILLFLSFIYLPAMGQSNEDVVKFRVKAINLNDSITSVSNEVEVRIPMRIYLPNAFTPNGDGLNDTFGALGEGIEEFQLKIFNRWGELLFESSAMNHRWDGKYKGQPVPVGTYVYEAVAMADQAGQIVKQGSVTLVY